MTRTRQDWHPVDSSKGDLRRTEAGEALKHSTGSPHTGAT
jgi:hypothetical protein